MHPDHGIIERPSGDETALPLSLYTYYQSKQQCAHLVGFPVPPLAVVGVGVVDTEAGEAAHLLELAVEDVGVEREAAVRVVGPTVTVAVAKESGECGCGSKLMLRKPLQIRNCNESLVRGVAAAHHPSLFQYLDVSQLHSSGADRGNSDSTHS